MKAIILLGGFGKRLASVVPNLPKPMAPINGKPFLGLPQPFFPYIIYAKKFKIIFN
jgi:dTDP-glucose pyrophosphorylase